MEERMDIAAVAKRYRISARTLRYYEEAGLLASHRKPHSQYREYDTTQCKRLEVVLLLRRLSFSIKEIADMLKPSENGTPFVVLLHQKLAQSRRTLHEANETHSLLTDVLAAAAPGSGGQGKSLATLDVPALLAPYMYLTQKTERMVPVNKFDEKYVVLIHTDLIPYVAADTAGPDNLMQRINDLRRTLAQETRIQVPPVRIRDDVNLGPGEAALHADGQEVWRKAFTGEQAPQFVTEVVAQLEQALRSA